MVKKKGIEISLEDRGMAYRKAKTDLFYAQESLLYKNLAHTASARNTLAIIHSFRVGLLIYPGHALKSWGFLMSVATSGNPLERMDPFGVAFFDRFLYSFSRQTPTVLLSNG